MFVLDTRDKRLRFSLNPLRTSLLYRNEARCSQKLRENGATYPISWVFIIFFPKCYCCFWKMSISFLSRKEVTTCLLESKDEKTNNFSTWLHYWDCGMGLNPWNAKTNQWSPAELRREAGEGSGTENIHLTQFSSLLRFAVITEHQAFSVAFLSSCLWGDFLREDNNTIASPSHNCRPGGALIFTLGPCAIWREICLVLLMSWWIR